MKNRILAVQDALRSSYWFIPAVTVILGILLSIVTIELDETVGRRLAWISGLVYVDSTEGARAVLSVISGSMITVAGVVFSLMMVVLSLTAQQYSSLVLNNFLRDRGNQFVLGVFTATFVYCLLVLRTIRGQESSVFVPHISVLTGIGLAIASLAVLTYFIHHVSSSLRASTIIARISDDLQSAINDLFPAQIGIEPPHSELDEQAIFDQFNMVGAQPVRALQSGYIQYVDQGELMEAAKEAEIVLDLKYRPGQFIVRGSMIGHAYPPPPNPEKFAQRVNDALIVGDVRTQAQDIEFLIDQLVAMAVRALSPAINDPFTAMMVIDRLGEALCTLVARDTPSRYRFDEQHQLRVITHPVTFDYLVRSAFDQIRHYGKNDLKVMARLLKTLKVIRECAPDHEHLAELRHYIDRVWEETHTQLPLEHEHFGFVNSHYPRGVNREPGETQPPIGR